MWRCLLSLVLLLALCVGPARAQAGSPAPENAERPPPPLAWAVAFLCTAGILVIVCMPSRKA